MLQTKRLGDLLTFQRGFDITKKEQKAGPIPIVSSSGIGSYHNVARVTGPGIVIGRKGTLGTVHYLRKDFWPHDTTLWVREFKDATPEYLRYFLPSLQLKAFDVGASNPTLNRNHLHKLKVKASPPEVQSKIAAILTAYDDLIENNRQRIALLEKMAEEIYREWFVRLRFPGHERTPVHKGVPEGWEVAELGSITKINEVSHTVRSHPESILYIDIASVGTNHFDLSDEMPFSEAPGRARRKVRHGDIIWSTVRPANRGYAVVLEPHDNTVCSTGFAVLSPTDNAPFSYIHQLTTTNPFVEHIANVAKGAAYPAASAADFTRAPVLLAPAELRAKFHFIAEPMYKQMHMLKQACLKLSETRDLLLNRLISGKLRVDDLDIQFPPSMHDKAA